MSISDTRVDELLMCPFRASPPNYPLGRWFHRAQHVGDASAGAVTFNLEIRQKSHAFSFEDFAYENATPQLHYIQVSIPLAQGGTVAIVTTTELPGNHNHRPMEQTIQGCFGFGVPFRIDQSASIAYANLSMLFGTNVLSEFFTWYCWGYYWDPNSAIYLRP
jgi:hypothetical protein